MTCEPEGRDSVAEVVAHGEVVLLAVPADAVDAALEAAGSLDGKVLIDATNDLVGNGRRWLPTLPSWRPVRRW